MSTVPTQTACYPVRLRYGAVVGIEDGGDRRQLIVNRNKRFAM